MSPSLDGEPDSDDLNDIIDTPAPPDIGPPPYEGCVPEGWHWPSPNPLCGTEGYWAPNTITVDQSGEDYIVNAKTQSGAIIVTYAGFESRDNAEAYKTYLSTCQKPRCDGGTGGSGILRNGIKILNVIDTRAKAYTMVGKDFSRDVPDFKRDDDGATRRTEAGLVFWRFESRSGSFASGGPANKTKTNRPEWNTGSSTRSGISGGQSMGTIGAADDPRDVEVTYIVRVHTINDPSEGWSLKCRGNGHSAGNENTLSMSFGYPYSKRKNSLYGVEISHPSTTYRNVNIRKSDYLLPGENKWIGIKNVIYNINNNKGIHCDCYVDEDPIVPGTNIFRNDWVLVWDYEESRNDTPTWAGPSIQLRVDQAEQQDVAAFEVVGIIAPKAVAAMTNILPLNTDQSHSEEFTIADGDIMY
jgi:hypothetical protein